MNAGPVLSLDAWPGRVDVAVVGSGPSAVAFVEHLLRINDELTIAMIERGGVLATTNVRNFWTGDRSIFIEANQRFLWEGDFAQRPDDPESGGMMILAVGGRGVVAGAHLPRFYSADLACWPDARWPLGDDELRRFSILAEDARDVGFGEVEGRAQNWAMSQLRTMGALPPPWAFDSRSNGNSRGFDSSVGRLWKLLCEDFVNATIEQRARRLLVFTDSYVMEIDHAGGSAAGVIALDVRPGVGAAPRRVEAETIVLAGSPIESARLVLASGLGRDPDSSVGCYLAEHVYCRGTTVVEALDSWLEHPDDQRISVVVPPSGEASLDRFQIDVEAWPAPGSPGMLEVRFTGSAAMDPQRENRVLLSNIRDEHRVCKAKVVLRHSPADRTRTNRMREAISATADQLSGHITAGDLRILPPGRSHHEVGTLRMGVGKETATDPYGKLHELDNVYVADASVFPCVGVANPMLTVTALAYRLAEHIDRRVSDHGGGD